MIMMMTMPGGAGHPTHLTILRSPVSTTTSRPVLGSRARPFDPATNRGEGRNHRQRASAIPLKP
jgi:hypothetical protein